MDRRGVAAFVGRVLEDEVSTLLHELAAHCNGLTGLNAQPSYAVTQPDGVDSASMVFNRRLQPFEATRKVFHVQPLERAENGAVGLEKELGDRHNGRERL